jgi:hypothetical protein
VTWFSISYFFVPLVVLIFCNACICFAIWRNLGKSNAASSITINLQPIQVINLVRTNVPSSAIVDGKKPRMSTASTDSSISSRYLDETSNGISRAKMRSVQQTVVIILSYILCSTPFIFAQLWAVWGSPSVAVSKSIDSLRLLTSYMGTWGEGGLIALQDGRKAPPLAPSRVSGIFF